MAVATWKARLIKNGTSIGGVDIHAPADSVAVSQYDVSGNDGSIFAGMQEVFGGTLTIFYRSDVMPTSPYAQIDKMSVAYPGPILDGINISGCALNDVYDFRFDESAPMGVRMVITRAYADQTDARYEYYRGNDTIFTYSQTITSDYFTTNWGMYQGVTRGYRLLPLPTFPGIQYLGTMNTDSLVTYSYNSTSMETTTSRYRTVIQKTFAQVDADKVRQWLGSYVPKIPDPYDPYDWIDPSEPSGPSDPDGIPEDANIDFPDLPTTQASDTGFIKLYNPDLQEVKDLADYMWTGLFDVNSLRKLFADPMDCLLGFNMVPVAVPNNPVATTVYVGNVSTSVQMKSATTQWVEVDCGSIDFGDAFGCYLSYAPYTKISLYLPYIGNVQLSTDDVVGKTLALKYHVDVLSCACVAYLKCGTSVLYQFSGTCGYSIPLSSNDFRNTITAIVSLATTAVALGTGGMTAAEGTKAVTTTVNNVMNAKPVVHRSGAIGSAAGMLGMQKPYLIVEYPNPCKPKKQYHYTGYPSFVTVTLGSLTGFASFESVILDGIPCTDEERQIILGMCQEGIYL